MVRRYCEVVDVRAGEQAQGPSAFVWRDRLYVVRDVMGHWCERRAWWTGAAAQALHGDGLAPPDGIASEPDAQSDLGAEREIWRVEASQGRTYSSGVYDLCRDVSAAGGPGAWRLLRVAD